MALFHAGVFQYTFCPSPDILQKLWDFVCLYIMVICSRMHKGGLGITTTQGLIKIDAQLQEFTVGNAVAVDAALSAAESMQDDEVTDQLISSRMLLLKHLCITCSVNAALITRMLMHS
jgi:hypothetical protein